MAGTIRELGLIEMIDERLGKHDDESISAGEAIAGMIINGLGFSDRPLSLIPQFFNECPLDSLFDRHLDPDDFNRFKLGRVLDRAATYGCDLLFTELAQRAARKIGIDTRFGHLDTTSFSVTGEYLPDTDENAISITYGYSKDKRPDLKQAVLEMMVSQDGGIPLIAKSWDGNSSDNVIFGERSKYLADQLSKADWPEFLVADSKLYTKENTDFLESVAYITRIPNTIKNAVELINTALAEKNSWISVSPSRKYQTFNLNHYGISQRWIVVYSQEAENRSRSSYEKKVQREKDLISKDLFHLQAKRFSCKEDAHSALYEKSKKWKYHLLGSVEYREYEKYAKKGRPSRGTHPETMTFQITATTTKNKDLLESKIRSAACYIVGTNADRDVLSDTEAISNYSQQNQVEKGFRFLKDPIFFASSLFVKKPSRISGLLMVMSLALLVYSVAERQLRKTLQEKEETLPNQINQPTKTPTLRWVFQILRGINVITVNEDGFRQRIFKGINELRRKILSMFSEKILSIYQISLT